MSLLIWPIIIPLIASVATASVGANRLTAQRVISLGSMLAYAVVAGLLLETVTADGIQVLFVGSWPAPFGIALVADRLSALMICLVAIVGSCAIIYSTVDIDRQRVAYGYYPLTNVLMMGISGAFLTGDIFNLYVWFEVLLMSSFVLLGLGGKRRQLQGTAKYVFINLVSSTIFLSALGLLYGVGGTLNMAQLAVELPLRAADNPALLTTIAILFMVGFGIKAAMFPFFFWMPASYHTPPVAISGFFAGLLTKVGVYSLVRSFTLIFAFNTDYTHSYVLLILAGFTMVTGVFGAMSQMEMRRILAFHSVSQVGYMLMGLALAFETPLALAGTIIFILHHSLVKSNLFFISGIVLWLKGTAELKNLGGLINTRPLLSVFFFIAAMSLAGIPPLSGFWAKFALILGGLDAESWVITGVALFTGVWTLYSMTKIWSYAFWQKPKPELVERPIDYSMTELRIYMIPVVILLIATIWVGVSAETFMTYATETANQLLNQDAYINAVLNPEVVQR